MEKEGNRTQNSHAKTINVWHICLHFVTCSGRCRWNICTYHTLSVWDNQSWFSMNSGLATFSKLPRNVLQNFSKHRDVSWLSQYKSHGKGLVSEGASKSNWLKQNNWALGVECRRFPTLVMRYFLEQTNPNCIHGTLVYVPTFPIFYHEKINHSCRLDG